VNAYRNYAPAVPDTDRMLFLVAIRPSLQQANDYMHSLIRLLRRDPRTRDLVRLLRPRVA
jgi:hypothetical protein